MHKLTVKTYHGGVIVIHIIRNFVVFFSLFFAGVQILPATIHAKTCVHIASYNTDFFWTNGIQEGMAEKLKGHCTLETHYMDTKATPNPEAINKKGETAKEFIESKKADVVLISDDDALTAVLLQYYKKSSLPFVFCGINWSIEQYGLPFAHTTGMIEIDPVQPLVQELMRVNKQTKTITRIAADTPVDYIISKHLQKKIEQSGITFKTMYVKDLDEWKKAYVEAQTNSDVLYLGTNGGIKNWDHKAAMEFADKNIKRPIVTNSPNMVRYVTFGITKRPQEQGEWAAEAAIKILKGTAPKDIPVSMNRDFLAFINTRHEKQFKFQYSDLFLKKAKKTDGLDVK